MEGENVDEDILRVGPVPFEVEVDLMTPIDPEGSPKVRFGYFGYTIIFGSFSTVLFTPFMQVHVPPLNHIGLWVDNLESAVEWMQKEGVRFTPGGIRPGASGHNITFIHPKGNKDSPISGNGVLIELVQAPSEVIKAFGDLQK